MWPSGRHWPELVHLSFHATDRIRARLCSTGCTELSWKMAQHCGLISITHLVLFPQILIYFVAFSDLSFKWYNCAATVFFPTRKRTGTRKRNESISRWPPVLVEIQVAPDLFSLRENQTQWGRTHCCPFLEPVSDASFSSCLWTGGPDTDPTPPVIIQLPRVSWPVNTFLTHFWLNMAALVCVWVFLL